METISHGAFSNCPIVFSCDLENQYFTTDDRSIYSKDGTTLILVSSKEYDEDYVVNENITKISNQAFRNVYGNTVNFTNQSVEIADAAFFDTDIKNITFPTELPKVPRQCFAESRIEYVFLSKNTQFIGEIAFSSCSSLKEVIMEEGLIEIQSSAFSGSTNVIQLIIPESVTSILTGAFTGIDVSKIHFKNQTRFQIDDYFLYCDSYIVDYIGTDPNAEIEIPSTCVGITDNMFKDKQLKKINFTEPSSLTTIGQKAFYGSTLKEIVFPNSLSSIGVSAFADCKELTTVTVKGEFSIIPEDCFNNCEKLTTFTVDSDNQIQIIQQRAFKNCKQLDINFLLFGSLIEIQNDAFNGAKVGEKAIIPSTISKIGTYVFYGSQIQTLYFFTESQTEDQSMRILLDDNEETDSINRTTEIPLACFSNCDLLSNIIIGDSIKSIGSYAFSNCPQIVQFNLSASIETIKSYSFYNCIQLTTVLIPNGSKLDTIQGYAFENTKLTSFEIKSDQFIVKDGALMNQPPTELIYYIPNKKPISFVVPNTIKRIRSYAFLSATNIWEIIIPEGELIEIGYQAFANCTSLRKLNLPNSLQNIQDDAFLNCNNILCGGLTLNETLKKRAQECGMPETPLTTDCLNNIVALFRKATCKIEPISFGSHLPLFAILLTKPRSI